MSYRLQPSALDRSAKTNPVDVTGQAVGVDEEIRAAATGEFDIVHEWGEQSFPASDPPCQLVAGYEPGRAGMKVLSEVGAVTLDESYPGDRGYLAFAALSAPAVLVAAVELRSTW